MQWQLDYVRARYRAEALAQGAKTMSGMTPDQRDTVLDQHMEDYRRRKVERAGSINKLTEELGVLGQTWDSLRSERETELMAELVRQRDFSVRFRDRRALMVTPKQMKRYYDTHRDEFIEQPSADLAVVVVLGGTDPQTALQRAEEAAEAWRATADLAAADLTAKWGAVALDDRLGVKDSESDQNAPPIRAFAGKAPQGEVSEPVRMGRDYWLLKVLRRREGRDDSFDDASVQAGIQRALADHQQLLRHNNLILKSQKMFPLIRPSPRIPRDPGPRRGQG